MRRRAGRRIIWGGLLLVPGMRSVASKDFRNPFYVLLLASGIMFAITACAYGVMAFRTFHVGSGAADAEPSALMRFLEDHGGAVMGWELAALAAATAGAIGTDRFWKR